MNFTLEFDHEDGRWMAEILELPGVIVYGESRLEAKSKVEALALRVLEERANLEQS
jgi:predicted RNase H-like HicB family nuclease